MKKYSLILVALIAVGMFAAGTEQSRKGESASTANASSKKSIEALLEAGPTSAKSGASTIRCYAYAVPA